MSKSTLFETNSDCSTVHTISLSQMCKKCTDFICPYRPVLRLAFFKIRGGLGAAIVSAVTMFLYSWEKKCQHISATQTVWEHFATVM